MRTMKIAGLAVEGVGRTPLRLTLTALGVTIASGALVTMVAFALGLQRQVETPFRVLALLNNIQVSPKDDADSEKAPPLDDAALAQMAQLPGVAAAYPDIQLRGLKIRCGEKTEMVFAVGIPREAGLFGVAQEILIAGSFFSQQSEPETMMSAPLAGALGFDPPETAVGTSITLEASGLSPEGGQSFAFQRKSLAVTIVGVFEPPVIMAGPAQRSILLPVELMKEIPGVRFESALNRLRTGARAAPVGYSKATVRVRDPADLASVEPQIQAMGFRTRTVVSQLRGMQTFFFFLQVLLASIGTVALVIAALGIVNTLLIAVLERYQEIGIYKAIGASDGDIFTLFLTEAGIVGLLGGLGGLALGWLVSLGLEAAANAYARSHGTTEHLALFAFPFWLLAGTVLFAMLVSVLAGVYPALRAARVDPIRALRRE